MPDQDCEKVRTFHSSLAGTLALYGRQMLPSAHPVMFYSFVFEMIDGGLPLSLFLTNYGTVWRGFYTNVGHPLKTRTAVVASIFVTYRWLWILTGKGRCVLL